MRGSELTVSVALIFDEVCKVYASSLDRARTYAFQEMLGRRRGPGPELRPGEFFALRNVSFQLPAGSALLLLGTPGSGKSTVAKLVAGLLRPDAGRVQVHGRVQLVGSGKMGLNPYMTVGEGLELAVGLAGVPLERSTEVRERILHLCGLEHLAGNHLADFPKRLLRLLAFSAALESDADLFVFDENVVIGEGAVREYLTGRVAEIMETRTVLIATSKPLVLPRSVQHALALHDGEVLLYGDPKAAVPIFNQLLEDLRRSSRRERGDDRAKEASANRWAPLFAPEPFRPVAASRMASRTARRQEIVVMSPLVLEEHVARLRDTRKTVLAGPWLADAAIEVLYWIPFLRWVQGRLREGQRLVALSRGGLDRWYSGEGIEYRDIYDLMPPVTFDEWNRERVRQVGSQKQLAMSDFERDMLAGLDSDAVEADSLVHPSLMMRIWTEVWRGRIPSSFVSRYAVYRQPAIGPDEPIPGLPPRYIAVKFEYSAYFMESDATLGFVETLTRQLSRRVPVVVLNTGFNYDNYRDGAVPDLPGVHRLPVPDGPRHHLDSQTRALARATALVGTYGGVSYLAPFCGIDAFTVFADPVGFFATHLNVMRGLATAYGASYAAELASVEAVPHMVQRAVRARPRRARLSSGPRGLFRFERPGR